MLVNGFLRQKSIWPLASRWVVRCGERVIRVNGIFGVLFVLGHVAIIGVSADFQKVVSVPPAIFTISREGDACMKQTLVQGDLQSRYEVILDLAI